VNLLYIVWHSADTLVFSIVPSVAQSPSRELDSDAEFEMLLSGLTGAKIKVKNEVIDLTPEAEADMCLLVSGGDAKFMLAAGVTVCLSGICGVAPTARVLCEVFDGSSELNGAVRSCADASGTGVQFALSSNLGLNSDFLKHIFDWPSDGHNFGFEVSVGFNGNTMCACAKNNGGREAGLEFCTQFIDAMGLRCESKRNNGGTCLANVACASGFCVGGFCSQCPTIDSTLDCPSGKFCAQGLNIGLRCENQRGNGGACLASAACKSGHCVDGFCSECPHVNNESGCPNGKFCAQALKIGLRCENADHGVTYRASKRIPMS